MIIQVLKPEVAAKIAAGEVVERPASAVKELIENSLDAGATQVSVDVQRGGLETIRVVDNGVGIPSEEVESAFLRHSTSKITSAEDLAQIKTLGFRGEALPSIAAVAEVELVTRTAEEIAGTQVTVKHGSTTGQGPTSRPMGTTITVRRLFRNVPARLKFMKSPATENGRISGLVGRYSLAYPEVRFGVTIDGRPSFSSPGTGVLRDALASVYGPETAEAMLSVEGEMEGVGSVEGYVGPPAISRAQRGYITLFVNHRWFQSRRLTYAVDEAYQGLLMVGRHPIAMLDITMPLEDVDVNVHPAKSEVRFRWEGDVFTLVQRAVRRALVELSPVPAVKLQPGHKAESSPQSIPPRQPLGSDLLGWAKGPRTDSRDEQPALAITPMAALPILRVVGQVSNTYIVAEGPNGMYLIDQHTAHERVLFERAQRELQERGVQSQGMLSPATVEVTPMQEEVLKLRGDLMQQHGFAFETFGERSYILRSVPASLAERSPSQTFLDILDSLAEGDGDESWETRIASSIACHSAVRAGDTLEQDQMEELVRLLEGAKSPHTCPHGRPTMIHLSSTHLDKEFGRR